MAQLSCTDVSTSLASICSAFAIDEGFPVVSVLLLVPMGILMLQDEGMHSLSLLPTSAGQSWALLSELAAR